MKTVFGVAVAAMALTMSLSAHAVPWCYRGTIINNYAAKNFTPTELATAEAGMLSDPGYLMATDKPKYVGHTTAHTYAQLFVGGAGPNLYNVPGHGEVRTRITAPYSFTNYVGPGAYSLSQGLSASYDKCFGGPLPMVEEKYISMPK